VAANAKFYCDCKLTGITKHLTSLHVGLQHPSGPGVFSLNCVYRLGETVEVCTACVVVKKPQPPEYGLSLIHSLDDMCEHRY